MQNTNVNVNVDVKIDQNTLVAIGLFFVTMFATYVYSTENGIFPFIERDDNLNKTRIIFSKDNKTLPNPAQ